MGGGARQPARKRRGGLEWKGFLAIRVAASWICLPPLPSPLLRFQAIMSDSPVSECLLTLALFKFLQTPA